MLKASNRLGKKDFRLVYMRGVKKETASLKIWLYKRHNGHFRGSVIVSKRVTKRAVERNAIRRRVYEALGGEISQMIAGCDIVVSVKPRDGGYSYKEIKKDLYDILNIS